MAFKFLPHRKHRIGLIIFISIAAVVLLLGLLLNIYWSPILAKKVKNVVLVSSDSLYTVNFTNAELHVLRGQIFIYNITLTPDTAVYNRRLKQHLAPNNLVVLHVKRLVLNRIHPFKLYFLHELEIGEIDLNEPDLDVSYQLNHKKDTTTNNPTAWQKISKNLHSIHIGAIYLNDIKFKYNDYSGNKLAISEVKEMNLSAIDLLIDSATQTDTSRVLYCKNIIAELNNYKGNSPDGLYKYNIKHLTLSTQTSQLNAEGLSLSPVDSDSFFRKTKKDRFTVSLDSLQLNNFDYLSFHKYRRITASVLTLKNGSLELYNNPNKIKDPEINKIESFPNVALGKISTLLKIDTVLVKHIHVAYSEYNKKSYQTGTITFDNTNGRFINVTNSKAALLKNNICTVHLTSDFMNSGLLNVFFTFNLTDKDAAFTCKGNLGQMNLANVNRASVPFAMVKITSGNIKQFNFDINANSQVSRGKIAVLYNNLKVKLLKPDTGFNAFSGKFIESIYANLFIIKHDNPDKEGMPARTFNVTYVRPINAPFFKTIWATLLDGIKPSVGLNEKTKQATVAKLTEHNINKQQRLLKRALRKQRREEKDKAKQLNQQKQDGGK